MKAVLVEGKKGRTQRERLMAASKAGLDHDLVYLDDALSILDNPEPDEPDTIQVTLTMEEIDQLRQAYPVEPVRTPLGSFVDLIYNTAIGNTL